MKNTKSTVFRLLLLLMSLTILMACTSSKPSPKEDIITAESQLTEESVAPPIMSYVTADSIEELVNQSDIIVVGRVEKSDEIVNTVRDPQDPTQPDPNLFGVGQVYNVHVEQYLKGGGSEIINLIQNEGLITPEMAEPEQTIENAREQSDHIPLSPEKRYIFFLNYAWELTDGEYYIGALEPWRFNLTDKGIASPESPWLYADEIFLSKPIVDFISQVEQLVSDSD